jgi:transposase
VTSSTLQQPDESAVLSARLAEVERQLAERDVQLGERDQRIAQLEHRVAQLQRLHFGPRSERRLPDDPAQGRFVFSELADEAQRTAEATGQHGTIEVEVAGHKRRKTGGRRKDFPEHLPVVKSIWNLSDDARQCCGQAMAPIGHDESKELERIELTLVHVIARTKYACRCCGEKVVTAPGPVRVIDKGLLGPGFLAHVIVERFARHMPYYRLEQKYADEGLSLSRSVLCRSALRCAELLEPVGDALLAEILKSPVVQLDDTPVTIQCGTGDKRQTGHAWVYGDTQGRVAYAVTPTRSRDGPWGVLKDYRGYVQGDAYSGHDVLFTDGMRTEVGCWAHARRYFVDAQATDPVLAKQALDLIRRLYAIERDADERALKVEERTRLRQQHAVPALAELRTWLEATRPSVLPKSPLSAAIGYALGQWEALTRYAQDGRLPIDNNGAERALRPLAVGRKNWLFFGNEEAGKKGAVLFSLVTTCRNLGIEPRAYLRDVLVRIATCSDVGQLTPHGWKQHHQAHVQAREQELLAQLAARPA